MLLPSDHGSGVYGGAAPAKAIVPCSHVLVLVSTDGKGIEGRVRQRLFWAAQKSSSMTVVLRVSQVTEARF